MTTPPADQPEPAAVEDIDRTVEQLAEIIAEGGVIEAHLTRDLIFNVSLEGVALWARVPFQPYAVKDLADGLAEPEPQLRLTVPPLERVITDPTTEVDIDEEALLLRAIQARRSRLGNTD